MCRCVCMYIYIYIYIYIHISTYTCLAACGPFSWSATVYTITCRAVENKQAMFNTTCIEHVQHNTTWQCYSAMAVNTSNVQHNMAVLQCTGMCLENTHCVSDNETYT